MGPWQVRCSNETLNDLENLNLGVPYKQVIHFYNPNIYRDNANLALKPSSFSLAPVLILWLFLTEIRRGTKVKFLRFL